MKVEKCLFLVFCSLGIIFKPVSLVASFFILIYILLKELKASKDDCDELKKLIAVLEQKHVDDSTHTSSEIQKIKDSIISLKMNHGINKITRS